MIQQNTEEICLWSNYPKCKKIILINCKMIKLVSWILYLVYSCWQLCFMKPLHQMLDYYVNCILSSSFLISSLCLCIFLSSNDVDRTEFVDNSLSLHKSFVNNRQQNSLSMKIMISSNSIPLYTSWKLPNLFFIWIHKWQHSCRELMEFWKLFHICRYFFSAIFSSLWSSYW